MKDIKARNFIFIEMLFIAMAAVSIPALITTFQEVYSLSIAQSTIIPIISTIGGFFANLTASYIMPKLGLKKMNKIAIVIGIFATGILGFTTNIYLFFVAILLIGIFIAVALTSSSSLYAHLKPELQNYGWYHSCFGIGGITSPLIISFLLSKNIGYQVVYRILFLSLILILSHLIFSKTLVNNKYETIKIPEAMRILKKKYVYLILIMITIYAGTEQGIIVWAGNLFSDLFKFSKEKATFILSLFWLFFTFGRIITDYLEKFIGRLKTVLFFTISTIFSILLLLKTQNPVFFLTLSLGLAPTFPILQKYTAQKLPPREIGFFNGLVFAFTSIGNFIVAGSMGFVGERNLAFAFGIPVIVAIVISSLILYLHFSNLKGNKS